MSEADRTGQVWATFHTKLLAFIRRRVSSPQDAEDILQSVFLRVSEKADSLEEIESLSGWLHSITRNTIIDHYRARGSRSDAVERLQSEMRAEEDATDPSSLTGELTAGTEVAGFLRGLIREIPEEYARAVELADFEGKTQQEIADEMGISLSGMKSRVQRGRAKLRDVLLDCCKVELDGRKGVMEYEPRDPGKYDCCDTPDAKPWTIKEKEIVAVAISVAAGCRPCTTYHLKAARKAGASQSDIDGAVKLSRRVRDWAAASMESHGLGSEAAEPAPALPSEPSRTDLLVALGAAFVVHCTVQLGAYSERVQAAGLDDELQEQLIALAVMIEGKARSHAERKLGLASLTTESSKGSC